MAIDWKAAFTKAAGVVVRKSASLAKSAADSASERLGKIAAPPKSAELPAVPDDFDRFVEETVREARTAESKPRRPVIKASKTKPAVPKPSYKKAPGIVSNVLAKLKLFAITVAIIFVAVPCVLIIGVVLGIRHQRAQSAIPIVTASAPLLAPRIETSSISELPTEWPAEVIAPTSTADAIQDVAATNVMVDTSSQPQESSQNVTTGGTFSTPSSQAATGDSSHVGQVWVDGYVKKDGTVVAGYWRKGSSSEHVSTREPYQRPEKEPRREPEMTNRTPDFKMPAAPLRSTSKQNGGSGSYKESAAEKEYEKRTGKEVVHRKDGTTYERNQRSKK